MDGRPGRFVGWVAGVCAGELRAVYAYDGAEAEGFEGEGGGGEVRMALGFQSARPLCAKRCYFDS